MQSVGAGVAATREDCGHEHDPARGDAFEIAAIRLGVPDLLLMIPLLPEPNRLGRVLSLAEQVG